MARLENRYELRHVLGRGGMAEVWAAHDEHSGREVAVKSVPSAGDPAAVRRLRSEATITGAIDHPGVVGVHDSGDDGERSFLVMDLLPGRDLAEILRAGPVPLAEALRIGAGVADALTAVHAAGVVHGDIKPANVVVTGERVTVIDFGVAATDRGVPVTDAGVTYGTAPYMAPEQVSAGPMTPATDLYALGCLLTAALAGRPPFTGGSTTAVLRHHARATPPRLGELVDGAPPRLEELVERLLDKDPARRGTAAQTRDTLTGLLAEPTPGPVRLPVRETAGSGRLDEDATLPILVEIDEPADHRPQAA